MAVMAIGVTQPHNRYVGKLKRSNKITYKAKLRKGDTLLIVDVINDLEFKGGRELHLWATQAAKNIVKLKKRASKVGIPIIYANDNFGMWRGDFKEVYAHASRSTARGRNICRTLRPDESDYRILKPRHSAFFATPLTPLLEELKTKRILLAGFATNLCVLFTAHDAHMHRYPLIVFSDCCAAESDFDHNTALKQLEMFCDASICRGEEYQID